MENIKFHNYSEEEWARRNKAFKNDHKAMNIAVLIARILLTPIFIFPRIYFWVWDGTIAKEMFHDD